MKIICTKEEKERFITATQIVRMCPFLSEYCKKDSPCQHCMEKHIEWQIEGNDEHDSV